jgi:acyl-CoA thioester hydrolase
VNLTKEKASKGLEAFKVQFDLQLRFRDTDAMGHINNAVYFSYFELARVVYWERLSGNRDFRKFGFILVRAESDFKAPLTLTDHPRIGIRASTLGRSSWEFEYRIVDAKTGIVYTEGRTVQCCYDYERKKVMRISDEVRKGMADFDGVPL